jgi:hypothetical protein
VYLQVTSPSGCFREEVTPVMSSYPQAASTLVVRPPDLQRWPDYTYLVATRYTPVPGLSQVAGGQEPVGDHRAAEGLIDDRFQGPVEADH